MHSPPAGSGQLACTCQALASARRSRAWSGCGTILTAARHGAHSIQDALLACWWHVQTWRSCAVAACCWRRAPLMSCPHWRCQVGCGGCQVGLCRLPGGVAEVARWDAEVAWPHSNRTSCMAPQQ
eukprot:366496-Chlamydomonas_euryale.AAC.31